MLKSIKLRPFEIAANLNPALGALAIWEFTQGYKSNNNDGPEYLLAFLVLPFVMHGPTRKSMPPSKSTRLQIWLEKNPGIIIGMSERILELNDFSKEALLFASCNGLVTITQTARLKPNKMIPATYRTSFSPEVREILEKSTLCGKWFGQISDLPTILITLGLRI